MEIEETTLPGILVIGTKVYADDRGWFTETYSKSKFKEAGIEADFVQDNHSMSLKKGTLRGIHFQNEPMAQAKLIRCSRGAVLDVAVDLRKSSPNYKKWIAVELSAENKKQVFIPRGFGHGFLTLTDGAEFQYKVDNDYSKENDRSIRFDDPEIGVDWGIVDPIVSDKDRTAPLFKDSDVNFN
ncbi:MAG: dTDP-4-dehydrorhamnose 3,5-epimerase [Candidatus Berkelbacteria bacterium]|nr:dTDP-4-dehydrorhamnose 3,5-epimerase [Candidatus Berkelbacteria bacterium]